MRPGALAIFAKTIGLSRVKTRLAISTGTLFAQEFYSLSLGAVEEVAAALRTETGGAVIPYWAVAEEAGRRHVRWNSFPVISTGDGGLGPRLHTVYSGRLKEHGYVMMIGTDSPLLTPALLKEAMLKLSAFPDSAVIGPCPDGGFYLFAARIPVPENVWTSVEYSARSTLKELTGSLKRAGIVVRLIRELGDVDTVEDLPALLGGLRELEKRLPEQERLYRWLHKHHKVFKP